MNSVETISLRPATAADAKLIFEWRNDPVIVRLGSSQREVTWTEHEEWFSQSITSGKRRIFIVQNDGVPIGQVRFDLLESSECVISAYLLTEFTGRGWGVEAMRSGCEMIFEIWPIQSVSACVRAENKAVQSALAKVGFEEIASKAVPGHKAFQLMREKL
ncbi:MAG TPA: GNAT family N-acetyltransferase [Terriglobales bacterium]|nr:GNAT family N-acetyltransferase [Terriglobales bacterium]